MSAFVADVWAVWRDVNKPKAESPAGPKRSHNYARWRQRHLDYLQRLVAAQDLKRLHDRAATLTEAHIHIPPYNSRRSCPEMQLVFQSAGIWRATPLTVNPTRFVQDAIAPTLIANSIPEPNPDNLLDIDSLLTIC